MSSEVVVSTVNLMKAFSGVEVIKKCSMTVNRGMIYGFLGPNGAGKTTVMKMLTGLLTPTSGQAEVLGMDVRVHRDEILRNTGALIEVPVFFEHLSATENLSLHLAYMGVEGTDISQALEMVGLVNTGDLPVSKFSLGMRQRLAITRALIHKPQLLILDEPINGLDPMGIREMRNLFLDLVQNHSMTILISSHILTEIEHIADKIGIIADGVLEREIAVSEVKEQFPDGLEEYFFGLMSGGSSFA
jgi:ABC-2 type transport system ATP-binding protein